MYRENMLFDAAIKGKSMILLKLLEEDLYLLDRVSYKCPNRTTPLHIATKKGHVSFVKQILSCNPRLAEEVDAQQSSPLHLASGNGDVEIVRALLLVAPDMCLSRDGQGRNPVHVAAIKGQVEVLKELLETCLVSSQEKADRGRTVLHLCVKYEQFEALKELLPKVSELVDWKDDDGDNILHMAARSKNVEIIQYLVSNTKICVQAKNSKEQTPLAIFEQTPRDPKCLEDVKTILRRKSKTCNSNHSCNQSVKWITKKRDAIMVVGILIATMAFQAGLNPPGGVWQEGSVDIPAHNTGEAIMGTIYPDDFKNFMRINTVAFITSLSTILLLISGLSFRRRLFMWMLMVVMWAAITSIALTYAISIHVVTPNLEELFHVNRIGMFLWMSIMAILFFANTLRLVDRMLKNKGIDVCRFLKNKGIEVCRLVNRMPKNKGKEVWRPHVLGTRLK